MSDEGALLAAIRAAPADDAPRLVYADWLDEHGVADRAAFIRVQLGHAARPADQAEWLALSRRAAGRGSIPGFGGPVYADERSLTVAKYADYVRSPHPWPHERHPQFGRPERATVARGFAEGVLISTRRWLNVRHRLLAAHPLRAVTLRDKTPARLAGGPYAWLPLSASPFGLGFEHGLWTDLFGLLDPPRWHRGPSTYPGAVGHAVAMASYPTVALALADLSRALLAEARAAAPAPTGVAIL